MLQPVKEGVIIMIEFQIVKTHTTEGQALLAHELTHVAQAKRGVHRSAQFGDSMELATAENEAEAHEMEHAELAELQGHGSGEDSGKSDDKAKEKNQKVLDRVLEMLGDRGRVMLMRGGPMPRRP